MNDHILKVICVTDNFGDGQRIVGARIVYDTEIDGSWISAADYWVKDRNITEISVDGCVVSLKLNLRDRQAAIVPAPGAPRRLDSPPELKRSLPKGGPPGGIPAASRMPRELVLRQVGDVKTAAGEILPPNEADIISVEAEEPIIDTFKQFEYKGIPYNLYIPEQYGENVSLPLVMFIHDAGPCGPEPELTLSQGCGAINFAREEFQDEHPCFVLAPQIDRKIKLTTDGFQASAELEIIKELLDDVVEKWNIDKKRIYTTGQSMGCMASCELNVRYPKYFAASLLVAGQWSPEKMAEKCGKCKMWILVSEHDARAFPGMNAVTEALEEAGTAIGRYRWDAKLSPEELDDCVREAMKDPETIKYTVFNGSTVVPPWEVDSPGSNHTSTWNVVYQIKELKNWLFTNANE